MMHTNNHWPTPDYNIQPGAAGVSVLFLVITAVNSSQNRQWHTKVNILRLAVGYLNATIKRVTRNTELEIGTNGSSKSRQTRGLMCVGQDLPRQDATGLVFGQFWNWSESFLQSEPATLAGYPVPLVTLYIETHINVVSEHLKEHHFEYDLSEINLKQLV